MMPTGSDNQRGKQVPTIRDSMLFETKLSLAQLFVLTGLLGGGVYAYADFKSSFEVVKRNVESNTSNYDYLNTVAMKTTDADAMRRYFELKIKYVEKDLERLEKTIDK